MSDESLSVALPAGASASTALLDLLRGAVAAFPEAFAEVELPSNAQRLKRSLSRTLVEVERARVRSERGTEVAAHLVRAAHAQFTLGAGGPSLDALELSRPPELERTVARSGGWRPRVRFEGQDTSDVAAVLDRLEARHELSPGHGKRLRRAAARVGSDGISLAGERFAILGAGAELAPTAHLLEAGAEVLWCDRVAPPEALKELGGLCVPEAPLDLLARPGEVAAAVSAFAGEGRVHLGAFAYAPGKGREWRLAAAMNAVAHALPDTQLASIGCYISPTSVAALTPEEVTSARARGTAPWMRALAAARLLTPSRGLAEAPEVADVVVPIQGVSYQAAQWIEKTLHAEALAHTRPALRVSARVAPITETKSLEHPIFEVAFKGAPAFGVSIHAPSFTRPMAALGYLEDILGPDTGRGVGGGLHGGAFLLGHSLESAIRVAAVRGSFGRARLRT